MWQWLLLVRAVLSLLLPTCLLFSLARCSYGCPNSQLSGKDIIKLIAAGREKFGWDWDLADNMFFNEHSFSLHPGYVNRLLFLSSLYVVKCWFRRLILCFLSVVKCWFRILILCFLWVVYDYEQYKCISNIFCDEKISFRRKTPFKTGDRRRMDFYHQNVSNYKLWCIFQLLWHKWNITYSEVSCSEATDRPRLRSWISCSQPPLTPPHHPSIPTLPSGKACVWPVFLDSDYLYNDETRLDLTKWG